MNDTNIIRAIATEWIRLGGDAQGILFCWKLIYDEVKRQLDAQDYQERELWR